MTPPVGQAYVFKADAPATPLGSIAWRYKEDGNKVETVLGTIPAGAFHLHVLIRPVSGGGSPGPPMAAAPFFAMPGSGGGMYGPALGGASVLVQSDIGGEAKVVITCAPPLTCNGCAVVICTTNALTPNEGFPTEAAGIGWSATRVTASFDQRPDGATIKLCSPAETKGALVASFESDPGDKPSSVSFVPVARAILKKAYPVSSGSDLGLSLSVTPKSAGMVRIGVSQLSARYLFYPSGQKAVTVKIRGDMPGITLSAGKGLRPGAFTFRMLGAYLPQRLTAASDATPMECHCAVRVGGAVRAVRRLRLTDEERTFPIGRCAVYGRSDSPCELLLSLHKANGERIGDRIIDPVSCVLKASSVCSWHAFDFGASGIAAPHDGSYWLMLTAVRGAFLWRSPAESEEKFQTSTDDGGHWSVVSGRPFSQMTVIDIPPGSSRNPEEQLVLGWDGGVLSDDCTGIKRNGNSPLEFEASFVIRANSHQGFFDRIESLGGPLELISSCRRDCNVTLDDMVFAYYT